MMAAEVMRNITPQFPSGQITEMAAGGAVLPGIPGGPTYIQLGLQIQLFVLKTGRLGLFSRLLTIGTIGLLKKLHENQMMESFISIFLYMSFSSNLRTRLFRKGFAIDHILSSSYMWPVLF
jgi:hypothetical protein